MSTKPRNPRYFPRMRVRGAHRRRLAGFQIVAGRFDRITVSAEKTAEALNKLLDKYKEEV